MLHITAAALTFAGLAASVQNCPGFITGNGGGVDDNYCCVGGDPNIPKVATMSRCAGWPICERADVTSPYCATTIPVTASNYEELASSASSFYLNDAGDVTATAGGDDQPTETGDTTLSATSSSTTATITASSTVADSTPTGDSGSEDNDSGAGKAAATLLWPICGAVLAYAGWQ